MDPPSYSPAHDKADVMSIHSNAPSYTSALPPSYEACTAREPQKPPQQHRAYSSLANAPFPEYQNVCWQSLTGSGHQNRAYANVAARRARRDEAARETRRAVSVVKALLEDKRDGDEPQKREDADAEYSLAQEAKSWDHLVTQMADWEKRE